MIEIKFDFKVSNRYKYYITKDGKVYKTDTRNNKTTECYYHIAHGYKRIRVTDIDSGKRRYLRVHRLVAKYFVKNPKPNGYRSLHYVLIIPIFLSTGKEYMKVEVQIRTIAMNFWASLEHQMHYKQFENNDMPEIVGELTKCAENIYNTDVRMQELREDIVHLTNL